MTRTYTPIDLVSLPRCSSLEAHVLVTELRTAGRDVELPQSIARSYERLGPVADALGESLMPQIAPPKVKRKADAATDNAWSATFDWLKGWCKLPGKHAPELERAKQLFELCFYEGLKFTMLEYKIEWQESQSRLAAVEREGHRETFALLGGAGFLANIEEAHAYYGEVLGITAPKTDPESLKVFRARRDAVLGAMREYVTKVVAHVEPDDPASQELCNRLLRPLVEWETRAPDADEQPAEQPETPAEPVA